MEKLVDKVIEWISLFGLKLIAAIAILFIGSIVIKILKKILQRVLDKRDVDKTISSFTVSLLHSTLWVFVILASLSQIGVQTTSFMAVIGAAGLAVGLALQGSLSNFAAGFLIIILRPFKVGDYVEAGGISGVINKISIFTTDFNSVDNKKIIVPNAQVMNGNIINYSAEKTRRVDFVFGVGYESELKLVKELISKAISAHSYVDKTPEPFVRLGKLGDSSLDITVRVWCKSEHYWDVHFDLIENVKAAFDANNINIPFPQMDVNVKK